MSGESSSLACVVRLPGGAEAIRRAMARAGTLAHHQSEAVLHRPLVLPEGADPELARIFGLRERP